MCVCLCVCAGVRDFLVDLRPCVCVCVRFELNDQIAMASSPTLLIMLMVLTVVQVSRASGVFELRFDRFQNELGRDAKGHCCDGFKASSSSSNGGVGVVGGGKCSEACRTQFRVCLKHYQTSIDLVGACTYGDFSTPILGDNSLDFTSNNSAGYTVRLPFEFSWPVSFDFLTFFISLLLGGTRHKNEHFLFLGHFLADYRSPSPDIQHNR